MIDQNNTKAVVSVASCVLKLQPFGEYKPGVQSRNALRQTGLRNGKDGRRINLITNDSCVNS